MSLASSYDSRALVKEQVRQAIDIVDLVGAYLPLRRQGRGFVAPCPWHDDRRPSLNVNPDRQTWRCWVCNLGGDVFSFVMQRERIEFREALEMLAQRAGIELEPARRSAAPPGGPDDKNTLFKAAAWAERLYHECLLQSPEAEPARRYLADRGLSAESITRFRLGYAPDRWRWLLDASATSGFTPPVLEAIGAVGKSESGSYYDRFKGRVIFPIRDAQGRPIALGGRVLPEAADAEEQRTGRRPAKYINSPETRLFSKREQLYGLDLARESAAKSRQIVVVEGYTDVVMAVQAGLTEFTAVLGTALTERHVKLLKRFADRVVLLLDGDEAGQRRTNEVLSLFLAAESDLRVLTLPGGLDPCDYLREHGAAPLRQLLAEAVDALEHKVRTATAGLDLLNDTHAANRALEEILAAVAQSPGAAGGAVRLREQQVLARLARQFGVADTELRRRVAELRKGKVAVGPAREGGPFRESAASSESGPGAGLSSEPEATTLTPWETELFEVLSLAPELAPEAAAGIAPEELAAGPARTIFVAYARLSAAGRRPELLQVLSELEDPRLQGLLVGIDEDAAAKAPHAQLDVRQRLSSLLRTHAERRQARDDGARLARLREERLDEAEADRLLEELFARERERQGLTAPKEG